jgi:hypothetical protein
MNYEEIRNHNNKKYNFNCDDLSHKNIHSQILNSELDKNFNENIYLTKERESIYSLSDLKDNYINTKTTKNTLILENEYKQKGCYDIKEEIRQISINKYVDNELIKLNEWQNNSINSKIKSDNFENKNIILLNDKFKKMNYNYNDINHNSLDDPKVKVIFNI